VTSAHALASGKHDIQFIIGADHDDPNTMAMGYVLKLQRRPVTVHPMQRMSSLGAMANTLATVEPADVYCSMGDDHEVQTPNWDEAIHQAWMQQADNVWWWHCKQNMTLAIVSDRWRRAAGRIYTDYFPFWWDDLWLLQIWRYASGRDCILGIPAFIKDCGPGTHRMRDLQFWTDFYWSRRAERIAEADRIRTILGWPSVKHTAALDLTPNPTFVPAQVEGQQGERTPPTPEYRRAKSRAQALMDTNG
jgi:hypothetical protein